MSSGSQTSTTVSGLPRVTRCILAGFVALHGLAHLAGTSQVFSDSAASSSSFDQLLGILWGLLALAFVVVGIAIWENKPAWPRLLLIISATSLLLLAPALWSTAIGMVIDFVLIAASLRAGALTKVGADW